MKIPGFLARQFYVEGSLRNTDDGFELQAQNPMGDGVLIGVGQLRVDGREIMREDVSATRSNGADPISAVEIDKWHPVDVLRGEHVTLSVRGPKLEPGEHQLEVELTERNLGALSFSITDRVAE